MNYCKKEREIERDREREKKGEKMNIVRSKGLIPIVRMSTLICRIDKNVKGSA